MWNKTTDMNNASRRGVKRDATCGMTKDMCGVCEVRTWWRGMRDKVDVWWGGARAVSAVVCCFTNPKQGVTEQPTYLSRYQSRK
jgi:hypothetical protein